MKILESLQALATSMVRNRLEVSPGAVFEILHVRTGDDPRFPAGAAGED